MDSPTSIYIAGKQPQALSPCGSRRRRSSSDSNSPEFEFWRVRATSQPSTLLSADQLFQDGVLLPLHLLSFKPPYPPDPDPTRSDPGAQNPPSWSIPSGPPAPVGPDPEPGPGPELVHESATTGLTASKRWRDIFKKSEKKAPTRSQEQREKEHKKREKKHQARLGSSELNINIWPFSRSRSAGNSATRPRISFGALATTRKVSSAPCSRSNSAGESNSRKWPSSPVRTGVHLGRSNPVWKARRGGSGGKSTEPAPVRSFEKGMVGKKEIPETRRGKTVNRGTNNDNSKARVLNLNVPMCIGYRSRLSCRNDEAGSSNSGGGNSNIVGGNSNVGTAGGPGSSLFGFRNLFTKRVH